MLTSCIVLHLNSALAKEQSGEILSLDPNMLNTFQF